MDIERKSFLASSEWKEFRIYKAESQSNIDPVTKRKLRKGFTIHHLNLDKSQYADLSIEENFVALNPKTHKMVHWLYDIGITYTDNDELTNILARMRKINSV